MGFGKLKQASFIEPVSVTPLCTETTQFCLASADATQPDQIVNVTNNTNNQEVLYRFEKVASASIPNRFTRRWVLVDAKNNESKIGSVDISPFHSYIEVEDAIRNMVKRVQVKAKEKGLYRQFKIPFFSQNGGDQIRNNEDAVNQQIYRWSTKKYQLERLLNAATSLYPSPDVVVTPNPNTSSNSTSNSHGILNNTIGPVFKSEIVAKCKKVSSIPIHFIIDLDLSKVGLSHALASAFVTIISNWRKISNDPAEVEMNHGLGLQNGMEIPTELYETAEQSFGENELILEQGPEQSGNVLNQHPSLIDVQDEEEARLAPFDQSMFLAQPRQMQNNGVWNQGMEMQYNNNWSQEIPTNMDRQAGTFEQETNHYPIGYLRSNAGNMTSNEPVYLAGETITEDVELLTESNPNVVNNSLNPIVNIRSRPTTRQALTRKLSKKCPITGKVFSILGANNFKQSDNHSCILGPKCPVKSRFLMRRFMKPFVQNQQSHQSSIIEHEQVLDHNGLPIQEDFLVEGQIPTQNTSGLLVPQLKKDEFLTKLLQMQRKCPVTGKFQGLLGLFLAQGLSSGIGSKGVGKGILGEKVASIMKQLEQFKNIGLAGQVGIINQSENNQSAEPHHCLFGKKCPVFGKFFNFPIGLGLSKKELKKQGKKFGLLNQCLMNGKCPLTGKLLSLCPKMQVNGNIVTPVNTTDQPKACFFHQNYVVMPGNACIYCPSICNPSDYCTCPEHFHYACCEDTINEHGMDEFNSLFYECGGQNFEQSENEDPQRPVIVVNVETCQKGGAGCGDGNLPTISTSHPCPTVRTNYTPEEACQCGFEHIESQEACNCGNAHGEGNHLSTPNTQFIPRPAFNPLLNGGVKMYPRSNTTVTNRPNNEQASDNSNCISTSPKSRPNVPNTLSNDELLQQLAQQLIQQILSNSALINISNTNNLINSNQAETTRFDKVPDSPMETKPILKKSSSTTTMNTDVLDDKKGEIGAPKPVRFENVNVVVVNKSSSSGTSDSSSGLVTSSDGDGEETSGLLYKHHSPKRQYSYSGSICSSSDDSLDYNQDSASSKIKSAVKCGIKEGLEKVSKVAQVTGVCQVAGKVLGAQKDGNGNRNSYLEYRLRQEASKKRVGSAPAGGSRYSNNVGTGKRECIVEHKTRKPLRANSHKHKHVARGSKKKVAVDTVESDVKSSDEETLEVDYDEEYDTHDDGNGNVWLHKHGHEKIRENSKRHEHKHRHQKTKNNKTKHSNPDKFRNGNAHFYNEKHQKRYIANNNDSSSSSDSSMNLTSSDDEEFSSVLSRRDKLDGLEKYMQKKEERKVKGKRSTSSFFDRKKELTRKRKEEIRHARYEEEEEDSENSSEDFDERYGHRKSKVGRFDYFDRFDRRELARKRYGTWHGPSRVSSLRYTPPRRIAPRVKVVRKPRYFEGVEHAPFEPFDQFEQPVEPVYQDEYYGPTEPEYIYEEY